ncbi:C39 family peptidase [Chloroflexota bacterium]
MTEIISIPHFQQSTDGYCLPTCARMVLAYLGFEYSEAEISQVLGTQDYGTPSFAVQRLTSLKLHVVYREWSVSELLSALEVGQPVIMFVRTGFLDYWQEDFAHTVVVVGALQDEQFWVHDPARLTGPLEVSWHGLLAGWAEFGYRAAILLKQS